MELEKPASEFSVNFICNETVPCNGTSIWGNSKNLEAHVKRIQVNYTNFVEIDWILINVEHDLPWHIYTDTGFEKGISNILSKKFGFNVPVSFTEQGMQDDCRASMEVNRKTKDKILKWFNTNRS